MELLLLQDKGGGVWECLAKPGRKLHPGAELSFGDGALTATVTAEEEGGNRLVQFHYEGIFLELLERLGKMPLPPYIREELADGERYQTVYSRVTGSAAAPTAGLHFTKELLQRIADKGVSLAYITLHVGLGTFRPVKADEITEHHMHSEFCMLSAETAEVLKPHAAERRPHHLRRHDILPDAGIAGRAGRHVHGKERLDGYLHLSRLSVPCDGRAHHQFPSAGEHAHHAGVRLCGL